MGAPSERDERLDTTNTDAEDFEIMEDGERIYAPPAHLAARFYRNRANARRKSSAASSRRNSLSSAHSLASSRSHRRASAPGCQSNYIAQHLRRASIIESRKARLADRAAHAEQVRIRAALAKAAPRGNSSSEERALAAQLAKEKHLAKVAAACAEEVARAKRIAEEVKERKLAEEARARFEMEERHAEAEKRRQEYQRNLQARRARRADSIEKKLAVVEEDVTVEEEAIIDDEDDNATIVPSKIDDDTAAFRIQRAWKLSNRRAVVKKFTDLYLRPQAEVSSFEEMTALVADLGTIAATTGILTILGLQESNDERAALNSRTFLSAYMLLGHSVAVLNNKNGTQEQDLVAKSSELLAGFERAVSRLASWNGYTANPTQLEDLSQVYSTYTSAFAAWRLQDSSVLVDGMIASFVELDAIWQTVKDDSRGEVASDYREGIRDNQVKLLSRIQKLAGRERADTLIKKAIRESRRRRPKKRPTAEVRPRGVETEASAEASTAAVESVVPSLESNVRPSGELASLFSTMPSNRVLTHELAIDKDYKLDDNNPWRDELYRSICESMKQGFEAGQGASWTVSAAENIREKLLRMLKPGNSMHNLIIETLDLEHINRQAQQDAFSYDGFFSFMANILPKLCAPFRDQEVKALVDVLDAHSENLDAMINKLFGLLQMVDKLSLDYSNFMIMNVAPTLIREAAGYESRLFAKDLEAGEASLERTKSWWREAHTTLCAEADRRDPEGIRRIEDRPTAQKVYTKALVDLAICQQVLADEDAPETLQLDAARLRRLRADSVRVTVIGAVLLTAKNLLKRDVRTQWKAEASRLWTLIGSEGYEDTADRAAAILSSGNNMPPYTKAQVSSAIARFFAQATSGSGRLTDPVLKVLFQRLKSHVNNRLSAVSSSERVRAASSASEALASCGLSEFTTQVGAIVDTLERVRQVDLASHGTWYEQVAGDLDA